MSFLLRTSRLVASTAPRTFRTQNIRAFTTSPSVSAIVDSHFVSQITAAEKKITNSDEPVKGGPTAAAQFHVGQELTSDVIHDITMGERKLTGREGPTQGGPTSVAQSILSGGNASTSNNTNASSNNNNTSSINVSSNGTPSGRLDTETMRKITEKEKEITGQDGPTRGGPTAKAQQHAGEPITSQALHDITEGEKKITGGERVKGGPTSAAQSELAKSRS
jgi:hypothetical protein